MALDERCKGCYDKDNGCLVKYHPPIIANCPCVDCLVKVMCNQMCKARMNIYTDLPLQVRRKVASKRLDHARHKCMEKINNN